MACSLSDAAEGMFRGVKVPLRLFLPNMDSYSSSKYPEVVGLHDAATGAAVFRPGHQKLKLGLE